MNLLRIYSISIVFFLFSFTLQAQTIKQGEWRDHLSYQICTRIADVGNRVYCAAKSGLISYDKNSRSVSKHSKISGLSDVLITSLAYSSTTDNLIIGYANGNIDLINMSSSTLINISDIKRRIITAEKKINQIYVNEDLAYLSCGFGIVVLNLAKAEIKETYILGENGAFLEVNDIAIENNILFAATANGIFRADLDSPNLLDFNYWNRLDFIPNSTEAYRFVESYNNKLFAVYRDLDQERDFIITISENNFQHWNKSYNPQVNDIYSINGFLSIGSPSRAVIYHKNEELYADFTSYNTNHIFVDTEGIIYIASGYSGFRRKENLNENASYLLPNGPRFSEVSKIAAFKDRIWTTSGGPKRLYSHGGFHSYLNNKWVSYTAETIEQYDTLGNTYKIAIDPSDPDHVLVGSFGYGLIEVQDNEVIHAYKLNNTEAFNVVPKEIDIRVSGLDFDKQGSLYFLLEMIPSPLFRLDPDGTITQLAINTPVLTKINDYGDLLVTSRGQIWILTARSGIVVLEREENDFYRYKSFLVKNQYGNLLNLGFSLDEDHDGNIWVGTNNGPVIYYSPWNIFNQNEVTGYQVPIPRNDGTGIVDPLLFSESILDIETDGGNRKWLATERSGVFLVSEDGKETIYNFREENSPLLSNGVSGIGINSVDGQVFFATDLGLVSYGGVATEGNSNYSDVYVYPNPVAPEYEGPITITGLLESTIVKITDINGNIVWETNSIGGRATWDGRNFEGSKVATGVYFVMLSTPDGSSSHITKLLFLH